MLAPGQLSNSCHPGLHPLTCVGKGARSVSPGLAGPEALLELAQLKSPEWEKSQFSPSRPRPRGLEEEPVVGFCHRRALSGPRGPARPPQANSCLALFWKPTKRARACLELSPKRTSL